MHFHLFVPLFLAFGALTVAEDWNKKWNVKSSSEITESLLADIAPGLNAKLEAELGSHAQPIKLMNVGELGLKVEYPASSVSIHDMTVRYDAKFNSSAFRGRKQNSRVVTTTKLPLNAAPDQFSLFYYEITIKKSGLERVDHLSSSELTSNALFIGYSCLSKINSGLVTFFYNGFHSSYTVAKKEEGNYKYGNAKYRRIHREENAADGVGVGSVLGVGVLVPPVKASVSGRPAAEEGMPQGDPHVFFTLNGQMIGELYPVIGTEIPNEWLMPRFTLHRRGMEVEVNFGQNPESLAIAKH